MNTSGFYENSKLKNYYLILQIDRNAEPEVISFAYKALAKKNHPDLGGTAEKMKLINEAYDVLKDSDSKSEYDKLYDLENTKKQKANESKNNEYESTKANSSKQTQTSYSKDNYYTQPDNNYYQQNAGNYAKGNNYQQTGKDYSNENYYQQAEVNQAKENYYKETYAGDSNNNLNNNNSYSSDTYEYFTDDMMKKTIEKNISDNTYEVYVSNANFTIPWTCVCCLNEAERKIKVKYKFNKNESLYQKYKLIYSHFPICKKCKQHMTEFIMKKSLFIALPLLFGIIAMLWLDFRSTSVSWTAATVIGSVVTAASALLLNLILRLSPLEDNHANRSKAVNMLNCSESGIRFWFDNWYYAELFAKSNHTHAIAIAGKKDGREYFFLKGKLALQTGVIILIVWISMITILTLCLKPIEDILNIFNTKGISSLLNWWENLL